MGVSGQHSPAITYSDIEENRFVIALDVDVEAIARRLGAGLFVGNQRPTPVGGHEVQDRIGGVSGLVGEIQPRINLPQHAAREDADHDVRRLRFAVRASDRAGLDGVEAEHAVLVGGGTAETGELGVRPRLLAALELPIDLDARPLAAALPFAAQDKKRAGGKVGFVLAPEPGTATVVPVAFEALPTLLDRGRATTNTS